MQKARMIKMFAKENVLAKTYLVIRRDKSVMDLFLSEPLNTPPSSME
jgi:hypothetical protein